MQITLFRFSVIVPHYHYKLVCHLVYKLVYHLSRKMINLHYKYLVHDWSCSIFQTKFIKKYGKMEMLILMYVIKLIFMGPTVKWFPKVSGLRELTQPTKLIFLNHWVGIQWHLQVTKLLFFLVRLFVPMFAGPGLIAIINIGFCMQLPFDFCQSEAGGNCILS